MHRVFGHEKLVNRLGGAIASGRFPQAALLVGPPGIGKQRLALWCAQVLLCETGTAKPCEQCPSCVQAAGLAHPDMHWFVPLALKKKSNDPKKQIEEVSIALGELMTDRRAEPVYGPVEPTASHALASVRYLHRIVAKKPYQGRRKVVILGDASRLVVQEASPEAANALLKVLEEPPADTTLILTSESVHGLLPTIRSRCVPIQVRPVPDSVVVEFATEVLGESDSSAQQAASRVNGRIGALGTESRTSATKAVEALLGTLRKGPGAIYAHALKQAPWGARGGFTELLDALAVRMHSELGRRAEDSGRDLHKPLQALKIIDRHRELAARNVNPQLAMAVMARELGALK